MELTIKNREDQHSVALLGGRLHENKPFSGEPLFSNLIYWAHVEAPEEGTFSMHPHEGIEILTFIFEGGLEHFDTATNVWTPLHAGGVQLIQAGRGVSHSEKYIKGSRAFQIWFDPDFSKSLNKDAFYKDFQADVFSWTKEGDWDVMIYAGINGPIKTDAPGITAKRYKLPKGEHFITLTKTSTNSFYLMDGELEIEGNTMKKDAFTKVEGVEKIKIKVLEESELFLLESPTEVAYQKAYR
ncbi:MAG: pirin family protein [Flavobacteriales bacterium]|nr:pirin family protein [Flavobacteriales bacterium]